jgi:2-C-methyl-D-erythritol 4-phosphate cytidylyltransferase
MFPLHALRDALAAAIDEGAHITDEASAMERAGYSVAVVEGPACNIKVTVPADLAIAEAYLAAHPVVHSGVTGKHSS